MWFSKYGKYIIMTNFTISITSLGFQLGVLYPWHNIISQDLQNLTKQLDNTSNERS